MRFVGPGNLMKGLRMSGKNFSDIRFVYYGSDICGWTRTELAAFLQGYLWNNKENRTVSVCLSNFDHFMRGQTVAVFEGKTVYYASDIIRWFKGLPVID